MTSPGLRLQWRTIRDGVYKNYKEKYKTKSSFSVVLHRALSRLLSSGDIGKEVLGHQEVFYFIRKRRKKKIKEELRKEFAHRKFDEIWDVLTVEQRKMLVKNLSLQSQSLVLASQRFVTNTALGFKELTEQWISELENPTEHTKQKHPPDQRTELLEELHSLHEQWRKMEIEVRRDKEQMHELQGVSASLVQEFMNEVVEPDYPEGWGAAIIDLMRKAVKEKKQKKKRSRP